MSEITTAMQYLMLSMMTILEMSLLVIQAMTLRDQTRDRRRNGEEINKHKGDKTNVNNSDGL